MSFRTSKRYLLLATLFTLTTTAMAACGDNPGDDCGGLSESDKIWIGVGIGAGALLLLAISAILLRRHLKKRRSRLPGAPGARTYETGEYWQQRSRHLPGYVPHSTMAPTVSRSANDQPVIQNIMPTVQHRPAVIQDNNLVPPPMSIGKGNRRSLDKPTSGGLARATSRAGSLPPPAYGSNEGTSLPPWRAGRERVLSDSESYTTLVEEPEEAMHVTSDSETNGRMGRETV